MCWLQQETLTKEQILEAVVVEHYTAILPLKPKNWVLCHQPGTLEEATALMEAYTSVEASLYLMPKK